MGIFTKRLEAYRELKTFTDARVEYNNNRILILEALAEVGPIKSPEFFAILPELTKKEARMLFWSLVESQVIDYDPQTLLIAIHK